MTFGAGPGRGRATATVAVRRRHLDRFSTDARRPEEPERQRRRGPPRRATAATRNATAFQQICLRARVVAEREPDVPGHTSAGTSSGESACAPRQFGREHLGHLARRLVPVGRVLRQQPVDDVGQPLGHVRVDRGAAAAGVSSATRRRTASGVLPSNGGRAGRGLVEHAAEAEQVGAVIDLVAAGLLGGHVQRRAGDEPGARQLHVLRGAGEAEVGELDAIDRRFEQDVAGLDVAVDEPAGVGRGQPGGGLHPEPRDLHRRELADPLQPLFERLAVDELHDEVRQPGRLVLVDLVDGDEVVVRDGGGGAGLAAEPLPGDLVVRQLAGRSP